MSAWHNRVEDLTLFEALTGGAFDRQNWQHSGEFDQNFSKKSNAPGFARGGGDGRFWNWPVHYIITTMYVTQTFFYSPNAFIGIFVTINIASKSLPSHPTHYIIATKRKTLINIPKHWKKSCTARKQSLTLRDLSSVQAYQLKISYVHTTSSSKSKTYLVV